MALTKPRIGQLNTSVSATSDPITVLNQGSTTANADVGFLFNRANGLVSNVALYWSESGNTFVTAFTSNTGANNGNILVSSYTNLATGALSVTGTGSFTGNLTTGHILPSANITYDIGSPTLRFRTLYISGNTIDMGGAQITTDTTSGGFAFVPKPTSANPNPLGTVFSPTGAITTINTTGGVIAAGAINTSINTNQGTANFGNVKINSDVSSTSTTTGALVVTGGAGISGSLYVGAVTSSGTIIASTVNAATIGNSGATLTGTLSTAAQTNITSVGTLTSLAVGAVTSSGTIIASTVNAATIGNAGAVYNGSTLTLTSYANIAGPVALINNTSVVSLQITGTATKGGAGYHDFLSVTNQGVGGTNTNKFFRTNSTGNFEIINSAYTQNILTLTDDGNISIPGKATINALYTTTGLFWSGNGYPISTGGGGSAAGVSGQVQYNNAGSFGGTALYYFSGNSAHVTTGNITADRFYSTNNGNGTNYAVGDDAWLGDINIANTVGLRGQQDPHQGYIVFGDSNNTNYIGRSGTNPITVTGAFSVTGTITAATVNAATIGNISANHVGTGTYLTSLNASNLSSGTVSSLLIPTLNQNTTGSAATLTTSRNINGTAFNGSADITVTAAASTLTGATLASGVTASSLTSVGTLTSLAVGAVTSSGTIIASTVNAGTIGNISANHVGTGTYLTSLNATNLSSGTVASAQISGSYTGITGVGALAAGSITTGFTTIPVAQGGTGVTSSTGSGNNVLSTSPTLVTPALGTPSSGILTSCTGLPNAGLVNSSVTVTAGTGMSGGGAVSLGSSITLTNAGVTSAVAGTAISVSGATGAVTITNSGVTSAVAGTGVAVSAATGAVTFSIGQSVATSATPTFGAITTSGSLKRSAAGAGYLDGQYSSVETVSTTGAIYTIGGSYVPTSTTLSTMYGIGYCYTYTSNFAIASTTGAPANHWGMYVCSAGTPRIFLDSDNGTLYGTANKALYADLAEKYSSDLDYPPGTVVVFGGEKEITISTTSYDTTVAGVISTNPGYSMNTLAEGLEVALTGRVPCRVIGPVRKGQIVVTSDIPGVAQAIDNSKFVPGCVIGKALTTINTNTIETIEVVVGRF